MYLYEEYANRFQIEYSFIKHKDHSVIFIENDSGSVLFLVITKIKNNNYPNKYRIEYFYPYAKLNKQIDIEWDEYEIYLEKIISDLKNTKVITDPEDVHLICWETFLLSKDKYFSENASPNFLYPTIDLNSSKNCRVEKIKKVISELDIVDMWLEYQQYIDNYSYWLCDLIKK